MISEAFLDRQIISIKACMDLASKTIRIVNSLEVSILDPILPVMTTSESSYNLIDVRSVPHKTMHFGDRVINVENICQIVLFCGFASPRYNALIIAESNSRKFDDFHRFHHIKIWCPEDKGTS